MELVILYDRGNGGVLSSGMTKIVFKDSSRFLLLKAMYEMMLDEPPYTPTFATAIQWLSEGKPAPALWDPLQRPSRGRPRADGSSRGSNLYAQDSRRFGMWKTAAKTYLKMLDAAEACLVQTNNPPGDLPKMLEPFDAYASQRRLFNTVDGGINNPTKYRLHPAKIEEECKYIIQKLISARDRYLGRVQEKSLNAQTN